jgi:hypothetical protein
MNKPFRKLGRGIFSAVNSGGSILLPKTRKKVPILNGFRAKSGQKRKVNLYQLDNG